MRTFSPRRHGEPESGRSLWFRSVSPCLRGEVLLLTLLTFSAAAAAQAPLPTPASVRITMEALHAAGGVPPGWEVTLQAGDVQGGRQVFMEQGCGSCHIVAGANLPTRPPGAAVVGPELTGMGKHHPPQYFLEAIVNPNAVLIDGAGYIDEQGRSTMPSYPDLTVAQVQDLVAFLASLTSGGDAPCHAPAAGGTPGAVAAAPIAAPKAGASTGPLPASPPGGGVFLVQTYDIKPGQLEAFERWFRDEFMPKTKAFGGVERIETSVDRSRRGPLVTTVFTFRDRTAYDRWNNNLAMRELAAKFDDFIGLHGHILYDTPPAYRAASLSSP